jgi:N,N'-diacetyllegionaminate synthase
MKDLDLTPPYIIFETASFHGGDVSALGGLLDRLSTISYAGRKGVKFHTIAAQSLAKPDFYAFDIYRELEIPDADWSALISEAAGQLDVWLEMADLNCAAILKANRGKVHGIKFQASMLENREVLELLPEAEPQTLQTLVNVSGLELSEIESCLLALLKAGLQRDNLILQVGFQGYPTAVSDTMLNKISVLRNAFPSFRFSMADHVKAGDPFAKLVPSLAFACGCSHVEKHVCTDRSAAKYDHYSALEPREAQEMAMLLEQTAEAFSAHFINSAEQKYLVNSILQPCLALNLPQGSLVGASDLLFRRQSGKVLSSRQIVEIQKQGNVLSSDMAKMDALISASFRPARIAAIVACRMKSTRLKRKPLLDIAGKPALQRCLENCLLFPRVHSVVLATSTHPDDAVLETMTLEGRVGFHRGDPDDVLMRYLDVTERDGIDIVVRVTADNPTVSPEITEFLIDSHLRSGADFTRACSDAVGTGTHIISVPAMKKVIKMLGGSPMSEYMNWYFENNSDVFKINIVDLPGDLVRDYRLTLDYQADLDMFNILFAELDKKGQLALTRNVFALLDSNPEIAKINNDQNIVYQTDSALIDKLKKETRFSSQ